MTNLSVGLKCKNGNGDAIVILEIPWSVLLNGRLLS